MKLPFFKDCGIPPWSRLELPDLHRPSHYSCARHMQVILGVKISKIKFSTYAHMHICRWFSDFKKEFFLPVKMIFSPSIRNLRYLSPCSVLANIFEFVGLAVIAYYIFGTPLPRFDTDHDGIGDDDNNVNKASPARTACPGSPQPASSQSSLAPLSLPLRFENLLIIISNFDLPFCDSNPQPHVPSIQS